MATWEELDMVREAFARAEAGEDVDADVQYTRPFEDVRRDFLEWFDRLAAMATAARDPLAAGNAAALAAYEHDTDDHFDVEELLLDLRDTGRAIAAHADISRLSEIRAVARCTQGNRGRLTQRGGSDRLN